MNQGELFPEIPAFVNDAIASAARDSHTSRCAVAVLRVLYERMALGRENAVPISALKQRWRELGDRVYCDREVKAAVKELLEERGVPIGSARAGSPGYFLLCTPEDIDEAERPLLNEVRSLARRLRAINRNSEISRTLCGQLGIE